MTLDIVEFQQHSYIAFYKRGVVTRSVKHFIAHDIYTSRQLY